MDHEADGVLRHARGQDKLEGAPHCALRKELEKPSFLPISSLLIYTTFLLKFAI